MEEEGSDGYIEMPSAAPPLSFIIPANIQHRHKPPSRPSSSLISHPFLLGLLHLLLLASGKEDRGTSSGAFFVFFSVKGTDTDRQTDKLTCSVRYSIHHVDDSHYVCSMNIHSCNLPMFTYLLSFLFWLHYFFGSVLTKPCASSRHY